MPPAFVSGIPIYVQIADNIRSQILRGALHDGDQLTSTTEYATTYTQPIIVLHDTYSSTADATSGIIEALRHKGMTLVTVSELTVNTGGLETGKVYCRGTAVNQNGFGCHN